MTDIVEIRDAIAHINVCTGDPDAWRQGLTPVDIAVLLPATVADGDALAGLLAKIRGNHPALFDPSTGAPRTPAPGPTPAPAPSPPLPGPDEGQHGEAAVAMKKAEDDLAQQNSDAAQLDLHVIAAILNAHATTVEGGGELQRLQRDIEAAVRARTDLDTPAGARDFQRYLIDKLREIGAVVETAALDDTSKATLAGAWTALYETAKTGPPPAADAPSSSSVGPPPPETLPPYGSDIASAPADSLMDQLLGDDLGGETGWPQTDPGPAPTQMPSATPPPTLPMMSGLPGFGSGSPASGGGLGGLPGGLGGPRADESMPDSWPLKSSDDPSLADLLRDAELLPDPESSTAEPTSGGEESAVEEPASDQPAPAGPTEVHLPGGDTVTVSNPRIAKVIEAAVAGTPIGDAFRQQGILVPPPGTAVAHPLDPGRIGSGDIGMFTDRQALALDHTRALFDGQIQPVASVSGPSFLGWLHPPGSGNTAPSASAPTVVPEKTPESPGSPQPTRPASSAGRTG